MTKTQKKSILALACKLAERLFAVSALKLIHAEGKGNDVLMRRRGQLFFLLGVFTFASLIASIFKLVVARRLKCFLNFF